MTFPSLICFSLAAAAALSGAALQGKVELLDAKKKGSAEGVVVWLEPVNGPAATTPGKFILDQRNKRFLPHVLAIPAGSQVDFPNHDPIFHNAFSNFAGQPFDTGLYAPGTSHRITFRREGVVRVFCNIHANMSAVIVIVPSPYYAVSTADGAWRIPNVPPGEYRLRLFHERSTPETLARLETRVKVEDNPLVLPRLAVSEAGYLPVPHQNKHGRPYPAKSLESTQYLGGR
jgi:plastocyanin